MVNQALGNENSGEENRPLQDSQDRDIMSEDDMGSPDFEFQETVTVT